MPWHYDIFFYEEKNLFKYFPCCAQDVGLYFLYLLAHEVTTVMGLCTFLWVPSASAPWSYKLSEGPDHMEFPNRCQNALERGDKSSSAVLSLSIDCGRNLVTQISLDAEGRIQLLKHRCLLLFESPKVTQTSVWDGRCDLGGHTIPMISQTFPKWLEIMRDTPAMKSHPILETVEQKYVGQDQQSQRDKTSGGL